jgi:hypothetical protein
MSRLAFSRYRYPTPTSPQRVNPPHVTTLPLSSRNGRVPVVNRTLFPTPNTFFSHTLFSFPTTSFPDISFFYYYFPTWSVYKVAALEINSTSLIVVLSCLRLSQVYGPGYLCCCFPPWRRRARWKDLLPVWSLLLYVSSRVE